jgi:hypothetical protein
VKNEMILLPMVMTMMSTRKLLHILTIRISGRPPTIISVAPYIWVLNAAEPSGRVFFVICKVCAGSGPKGATHMKVSAVLNNSEGDKIHCNL